MSVKEIMGIIGLDMDVSKLVQSSKQAEKVMNDAAKTAQKTDEAIASSAEKKAGRVTAANRQIIESAKQETLSAKAAGKERERAADVELENARGLNIEKRKGVEMERTERATRVQAARNIGNLALQNAKTVTKIEEAEQRRRTLFYKQQLNERAREEVKIRKVIDRTIGAPEGVRERVMSAIGGPTMARRRDAMIAFGGMTPNEAIVAQLQERGFRPREAQFLGAGVGQRPPTLGGRPLRGGGGFLGGAGGLLRGAGAAFGVGVGAYAIGNIARGLGDDIGRATAYERQRVAAEGLAGSQAKLNELMLRYEEASGGAVDSSTALSNITRLLATGFAQTGPELEKFVRATRGASIALGKPQDYIIQETQLSLSNTSFKRLDQIGIGISEVNDRIDELRANNRNLSREEAFQTAVMDIMSEKYAHLGDTMEGQASGVEKLTKAWSDFRLELGQSLKGPIDAFADYFSERIEDVTEALDEAHTKFKEARDYETFLEANQNPNRPTVVTGPFAGLTQGMLASQGIPSTVGSSQGFRFPGAPPWMAAVQLAMGTKSVSGNEEEVAAVRADYYQRYEDLERQTGEQRLQVIEDYEQQREQIIISYGKNVVREEQDFARQRARSQRDFERSIQDMSEQAAEREADWQEDLDEKISDLRESANEKLSEVEEKYQKDRERSERDHRERLLKAAGQLDAIGVLEERKRWRKEQSEREEEHKEQVDEIRENLQEQIDEANEAHQERLEDAREADAKRLADMREDRARQLADEDEDRAIRLARAAEDHQDQLNALDAQHALRLQQIAENAAEEREKLDKAFEDSLFEVGYYVKGLHEKVMAEAKLIEEWFDNFVDHMEKRLAIQSDPGRYRLDESGRPVIPLDYGSQLGHTPNAVSSSITNSGGNKSVVISQGAVVVYSSGNVAGAMGDTILSAIVEALEKY